MINRCVIDIETIPKDEYVPEEFDGEKPEKLVISKPQRPEDTKWEDVPFSKSIKDDDKQEDYRQKKQISMDLQRDKQYEADLKKYEKEVAKHDKLVRDYDFKQDQFMLEDLDFYKKRSLNFYANQVVSISVKINDNPTQNFSGPEETPILTQFCEYMFGNHQGPETVWLTVGHFIRGFDIPAIKAKLQRLSTYMKLNHPLSQNIYSSVLTEAWFLPEVKPFVTGIPSAFDLYWHLEQPSQKIKLEDGRTSYGQSLDNILKFYGFPGKEDISGGDVYDLWCDGRIDLISKYNIDEVDQMAALYDTLDFPWSHQVDYRMNK